MIGVGQAKYAKPEQGPFKCANCRFFTAPNECGQSVVVRDAHEGYLPQVAGTKAQVAPEGCCNHFETRGYKK